MVQPEEGRVDRVTGSLQAKPVRRLSVLGATGSVGQSTLDLVARNPDRFEIVALTGHSNVDLLVAAATLHRAELAVIGDPARYAELKAKLAGTGIAAAAGASGLIEAGSRPADCVMAAIMGAAGLAPTLAAVAQGRRIGLANKECLVSAGDLFMRAVATAGTELIPVDSEHSAVFQAIAGQPARSIERITITASGGPFRSWSLADIAKARPEDALKHPNWSMGRKITIDSATLMNKGLELIEAFHLFPVEPDQLQAVVHPQSIVHCLVAFEDGSVLAQLACPDMRTPIALSLAWPDRMVAPTRRLDLTEIGSLTFEAPDTTRFPALGLAIAALKQGGTAPGILNAANEIAVEAFLERRIGFLDIAATVATCLERADAQGLLRPVRTLDDVSAADNSGRRLAHAAIAART
jgi:1-deoxy-D-xylulose-5-phosphate reductoisomerase